MIILSNVSLQTRTKLGCDWLQGLQGVNDIKTRRISVRKLHNKGTDDYQLSTIHKRGELWVDLTILVRDINWHKVAPCDLQSFIQPIIHEFDDAFFSGREFSTLGRQRRDLAAVIAVC